MKRNEMIEHMINFVESTPRKASTYHKMDMLLSRMERLGMKPPLRIPKLTEYGEPNGFNIGEFTWQAEDDDIGIGIIE